MPTSKQVTAEQAAKMTAEQLHEFGYYVSDEILDTVSTEKLRVALGGEDGPPAWCAGRWTDRCEKALARRFRDRVPLMHHMEACRFCSTKYMSVCCDGAEILRALCDVN